MISEDYEFRKSPTMTRAQRVMREHAIFSAAGCAMREAGNQIGELMAEQCQRDTSSELHALVQELVEKKLRWVDELLVDLFPLDYPARMTYLEQMDHYAKSAYALKRRMVK
jgi:hypothetical protein